MLAYWIEDLGNPDTTAFFPELWAMGNHDAHVAAMVDTLYARVREPMDELIALINPACSKAEARELSLFMCAAMEGLTVFAGSGKPWAGRRAQLQRLAIANFLRLIESHGRDKPADLPGPVA
jgi:truncated hemoglobin YjbI